MDRIGCVKLMRQWITSLSRFNNTKMDFVQLFPPELIEKIFYFLSVDDLVSVSRVSVSWYIASNSSRLWRAAIKQSSSRDRFIKLSDLDKFNGISSNYDSDHSFNVEKPPTSRLPPINPWKLSLFKHNFVQGNLRGERPYVELARHTIALENDMMIYDLYVTFPSNSEQDCLYLPVLGRIPGELNKVCYLIRLDGVPKAIKLFTTESEISRAFIDRHGIMWVEVNNKEEKVNYLPFVENSNSFQSRNSGSSLFESDVHNVCVIPFPYYFYDLTMDANHLAVIENYHISDQVKILCRKTFKLEIAITTKANIPLSSLNFNNGQFYLPLNDYGIQKYNVKIYDVKQDKLISVVDVELPFEEMMFGVKYYLIVSEDSQKTLICVREIKTNNVMFNMNMEKVSLSKCVWFDDGYFLYKHHDDLKVLSLVDWTVSDGMSLRDYSVMQCELSIIDRCLFVIFDGRVDVWDWKLGRKLQEIALPSLSLIDCNFYVHETRFVHAGETSVQVVGFW